MAFPSSSLSQTWEHDVFPSFHGKDVRKTFLSHVLKEFERKAINFFVDNKMKRGEFIGPELKQAIRGSKIVVVLLSKNYASSSWCLDELVEIMKSKKELGQTVLTVFYKLDPTDIKKQTKYFGKVFQETCQGKGKEKVWTWREALKDVATIAGYHSSNWADEATMIENIAAYILNKLNHFTPSHDFDRLIGMEDHMKRMNLLLRLDSDEVRMIGIWGPPGIGKTTIARVMFNQLSNSFQNSAFMLSIREKYPRPCLNAYNAKLKLQEEMLSQMIDEKNMVISHLGVARGRLGDRKVLLVLDDVDRLAQLEALAENVQWFGPGSRIIVTTEDLRLLKAHGIEHIHKVKYPSNDEALQMFCMYAFNQKFPKDGFDDLAREITYLVGELPLALEVIGSHFRGLPKEQWSMEVSKLKTNLHGDIESILKFSYDALCADDQDLFLHIACFFNKQSIEMVEELLAEKFKDVKQRLYSLEMKSLISIVTESSDGSCVYIYMHNLLARLGQEIVCKESVRERPFLIDYNDKCEVLTAYTTKAFERMYDLPFLRVNIDHPYIISSPGPLKYSKSPNLRLLYQSYFPMAYLCFTNNLDFLIELKIRNSKLEKLWDGIKLVRNLEEMDLSYSENLKELPNLSMAINLQKLKLSHCSSLVKVPSSIESATNLIELCLSECSRLLELPSSIGNLTNLERLNLDRCSNLVELPSSIGNLTNLERLNLDGCSNLVELPSSIRNLFNLKEVFIYGCSSLISLPQLPDSVRSIFARNCKSLEKLDCSFCYPDIYLDFMNCFKLNQEARDIIIQRSTLKYVILPGLEMPACFTYSAYGSSVTVKLNQKHLPTSTKFKACILYVNKNEKQAPHPQWGPIRWSINKARHESYRIDREIKSGHLHVFEFEVKEVTSNELVFEFQLGTYKKTEIKECGIIHLLEAEGKSQGNKEKRRSRSALLMDSS